MKKYKRYYITSAVIVIALVILFLPALKGMRTVDFVHIHSTLPLPPASPKTALPIDLTTVTMQTKYKMVLHDNTLIPVGDDKNQNARIKSPDVWAIQVGRFNEKENATTLNAALQKSGFPAFVLLNTPQNKVVTWQVLVGPMLDKAYAKTMLDELEQKAQVKGVIIPYDI